VFTPRAVSGTVIDDLGFTNLRPLIERMLAQNPTLQQAQARLTQAQAVAGASVGALLPSLNATGSLTRERNAPSFQNQGQNQGSSNTPTQNRSSISAGLNWPLDFFGKLTGQLRSAKRLRDSANADVLATKLALKAAVAQTYVQLLAAHQNVQHWHTLLAAAEEQNRLTQLLYTSGDIAITSAQPVFATLQSLRVQALSAAQTEQTLHHTLAALLGEAPQTFALNSTDLVRLRQPAIAAPTQVSATALLARPDIKSAAARLAASNANIGVARAAFLPNISITGNAGFAMGESGNLLSWNNRSWALGPVVTLPIFQGGALRANLNRAWGQYEESVGVYRAEVLAAYKETADALTALSAARAQAQSGQAAAQALEKSAQAYTQRYTLGDVSKIDTLNARILAIQGQIAATNAAATEHAALIELARSLGGGW
jgi:multidrug efflux system outer membrane protein